MPEWIRQLLEIVKNLLLELGIPDFLISDLMAGLIVAALAALLPWILKGLHQASETLRRISVKDKDRASALVPPQTERSYLRWLANELATTAHQWHKTPIVPTPAHRRKSLGFRTGFRAMLSRYDSTDYLRNPALMDVDLSVRAGFGRRVRIRNLARELRKFSKIIVLGDPGAGKSVCLRQLGYDLAQQGLRQGSAAKTLPIFLDMGTYDGWEDQDAGKPQLILAFIGDSLRHHKSVAEAPTSHPLLTIAENLEGLLRQGRATLIFDALDEMPQDSYNERYQTLKQFMGTWESCGNRFIYSCRSLDYDPAFNVDEVLIDPFDRRRIRSFLDQHVPRVADALYRRIIHDESLEELVTNPFFLQALAYLNLDRRQEESSGLPWVPASRGDLLCTFTEKVLCWEAQEKQAAVLEEIHGGHETLRKFLGELAFALQEKRQGGTSAPIHLLEEIWARYPQWRRLLQIARRARILGKRGEPGDLIADQIPLDLAPPQRVEFVHHRLQELFAAEELARCLPTGEAAIEGYLEDIWWQETVILAIGLLREPGPVINRLLARQPDVETWVRQVEIQARRQGLPGNLAPGPQKKLQVRIDELAGNGPAGEDLFDLGLVAHLLHSMAGFMSLMPNRYPGLGAWEEAQREGERLSRRRSLFVAAEALGQLPADSLPEVRCQVTSNLAAVIEKGNSLLKVRAFRALRFIASEVSIPQIEQGLRDRSPWVRATALTTLFRLNLRAREPQRVFLNFFLHTFLASLGVVFMFLFSEPAARKGSLPLRGLAKGLIRERGGALLVALVVFLWTISALWNLILSLVGIGVFVIIVFAVGALAALVMLVGAPVLARLGDRENAGITWPRLVVESALDYATAAVAFFLVDLKVSAAFLGFLTLFALWKDYFGKGFLRLAEDLRGLLRAAFLATVAFHLPFGSLVFFLVLGATVAQIAVSLPAVLGRSQRSSICKLSLLFLTLTVIGSIIFIYWTTIRIYWTLGVAFLILLSIAFSFPSWIHGFHDFRSWSIRGIRASLAHRHYERFHSFNDYCSYVLRVGGDASYPLWARTRAILSLGQMPVADPALASHLMDLARGKMPNSLRDAIYQVVDAIETRIQRGQGSHRVDFDPASLPVTPGEFSLYREVNLLLLVLLVLAGGLLATSIPSVAHWIRSPLLLAPITEELLASSLLILVAILSAGKLTILRKWTLILGLGFFSAAMTQPLARETGMIYSPEVIPLGPWVLDLATLGSIFYPFLAFLLFSLLGYILHFIDREPDSAPESRDLKDLGILLLVGLLVSCSPSVLVTDLIARTAEPMPRFGLLIDTRISLLDLPQDGRALRVALVAAQGEEEKVLLTETYPLLGEKAWGGLRTQRLPLSALLSRDAVCRGEVWLPVHGGERRGVEILPGGCLGVEAVGEHQATLQIRSGCLPEGIYRLVAIVANERRSPLVSRYAEKEFARAQAEEWPARGRWMSGTLSLSDRAIWGPAIRIP